MKWNVSNAISRDVERQQLNKILADIRAEMDRRDAAVSEGDSIQDTVGGMVENNNESGIAVTYDAQTKLLDFAVSDFVIQLAGDISGSGEVVGLNSVTISTTLDPSLVGVAEAPIDNGYYWRWNGSWSAVSSSITNFATLRGTGFPAQHLNADGDGRWLLREFEVTTGELTVANPTGETGNPLFGLADLTDTGVGATPVKLITRDAKGRVEGTQNASTTNLPEGTNLYYTDERAQDAVGNAVVGTGNVPLSYNDATGAVSAALSAGVLASLALADSSVQSVVAGTNITVDATDPQNPIISAAGGAGATAFTDLTDVPAAYTGAGGKAVAVKATEDGLEFISLAGGGTVTSVGVTGGVGIDSSGGPITTSGSITVDLDAATQASLALADSATQPGDLATVATTGVYADLTGKPTLGTAAATAITDYATAAQGALAATAVQPGRLISTTAPITGGGDLSANRTIAIPAATSSVDGYLTAADWVIFNSKAAAGTSFPGSPTTGQRYFRTDLGIECYYDGTRWLTMQLFAGDYSTASAITTSPVTVARYPVHPDYVAYLVKLSATAFVQTTNSGTAYWSFQTSWSNQANTVTSIGSAITTAASSPNNWMRYDQTLNQPADATARNIQVTAAKVSTPGGLLYNSTLFYRLIIP